MLIKYIPNFLTFSRLGLLIPFLISLAQHNFLCAFYIFLAAGITDALDGWLARTLHSQSNLGSFIDPLADKLLIAASFISLALIGILPWWLVSLVFLRDLSICLGIIAWYCFIQEQLEFRPTLLSKVNTTLQLTLITLCLFQLAFFKFMPYFTHIFIICTTTTTCATYIDYVCTWGKKAYSTNNSSI